MSHVFTFSAPGQKKPNAFFPVLATNVHASVDRSSTGLLVYSLGIYLFGLLSKSDPIFLKFC